MKAENGNGEGKREKEESSIKFSRNVK